MKGLGIVGLVFSSFYLFFASCSNPSAPIAKPVVPTLTSPTSGAANQPTTVTLTWSTVTGATSYHVQVSTSNAFTTIFAEDSSLTSATKTVTSLVNGTTYYWRVSAKNAGGVSVWTGTWSFSVILATPMLSSPVNGAQNQPVTATLTWGAVNNATTYHYQVSSSNDFSSIVAEDSTITAATVSVPWLVDSTTYYWRVSAKNGIGTSAWSNIWNFTTLKDSSFFEFGRSQGYLGYWGASDQVGNNWLYNFTGDVMTISEIIQTVDTASLSFINDTVEVYGGVFTLDSSVSPNAMNIYVTSPAQYKGQMIQTIYALQPVNGSFVDCWVMLNTPGAARPTTIDHSSNNFLDLEYRWTH